MANTINKQCLICKYQLPIGFFGYKIHTHHLNCQGTGNTIKLCSVHHKQLHTYILRKALEKIEEQNPNFCIDITNEMFDKLKRKEGDFIFGKEYKKRRENE